VARVWSNCETVVQIAEKRASEPITTRSITRLFAEAFPVHLAIHEVSPVTAPPAVYTEPHVHEDTDEINIIISEKSLWYKAGQGRCEHACHCSGAHPEPQLVT
jgi:hypothetical protein